MWNAHIQPLRDAQIQYVSMTRDGAPVTYEAALQSWRDDEAFRSFFMRILEDAPFEAYRFETPPVTRSTIARNFEFVLLNDPDLERAADPRAFADHLRPTAREGGVVSFNNLMKDATLIVPREVADRSAYVHLAAFIRRAPDQQRHELWQETAAAMNKLLGKKPLWLSTAGAGVPWLHVRLDSRPKYYAFQPFANA